MKSYKNLWEQFISEENIRTAIKNSSKGGKKKKRKDVQAVLNDIEGYIPQIIADVEDFHNDNHKPKIIYDGISRKQRTIIVPTYREQIIHHMIVNVLKPILLKGTYEQAYGSIPGRGAHKGKKVIEKWIRDDAKNCKYCLKLDIKKYFENISHDILKVKLSKIIRDKKFLSVVFEIIDATERGLPLGFYTSQWLSMWYLKDFDHFLKEQCYAPHYMRYVDDLMIFGANKRKLWETYKNIVQYLLDIGLQLNNRKQLFRFVYAKHGKEYGRNLDFMGFRFYRNRVTLRRSIYMKMCRKAKRIGEKEKPTLYELKQMLSYLGWIKDCNVYGAYLEHIKENVNFQYAKRRISRHDRKENRKNVEIMRKQ